MPVLNGGSHHPEPLVFTFETANVLYTIPGTMYMRTIFGLNIGLIVALKPFATLKGRTRVGGIANITTDWCGWIYAFQYYANWINCKLNIKQYNQNNKYIIWTEYKREKVQLICLKLKFRNKSNARRARARASAIGNLPILMKLQNKTALTIV